VRTGEVNWSKHFSRHFSASLLTAGGLVYFLDDFGVTQVIKPGKDFEVVAVNKLFDAAQVEATDADEDKAACSASPAISQGQVFIRTDKTLYCIGPPQRTVGNHANPKR
jgi:hypothetical protein